MDNYPEDAIKSFLRIEIPKIKDQLYYAVNSKKNIISLYDPVCKGPSSKTLKFELDKIFTNENENSYIYEEICLNSIKDILEGVSYSFIAYGETSSHKLDALIGNIKDSITNINNRGIYPRLVENLLKKIKHKENKSKKLCILSSFFLVYDNNLVDLFSFKNIDISNYTKNDIFNKAFIIKNETDIINKINKIKIDKIEDNLSFINQMLSLLLQIETNTNEQIYSRSHICIVLYLAHKQNTNNNNSINIISNISFVLLNGSEYLNSGNVIVTESTAQKNDISINNKPSIEKTKCTLETQYTYETVYNCIKSLRCLKTNEEGRNTYKNNKKENSLFSQLTTVLYNVCFSDDIKKMKFRIIGTILPNTGYYLSVKDTLVFLFDCRLILKKKKIIDYDDFSFNKNFNPNILPEKKKDDYIFELENKVKIQKKQIDEFTKNMAKKDDKISFLQKTYVEQINTLKKKLNFPGDINVLIAGGDNTKEALFVKKMKESQDYIKRNEGNIHILEKKLKEANDEIIKLKNKNIIKNSDETMVNYYLSVQKVKEERVKERDSIILLYNQIEGLKKEINVKNKINEQLKKEIENKNKILFNLPNSLKHTFKKIETPKNVDNTENLPGLQDNNNILDEKNININNNDEGNNNEKENNEESNEFSEAFISSEIEKMKLNHKKDIEVLEQKYKIILNEKKKELDELNSYINKMIEFNKSEVNSYKKEIIKYNEIFMNLISNYKCIFFSKFTSQCNIITLKNKKEEFDKIILNIDKEINHVNFPMLFKELESKNILNINETGSIANLRKASMKMKKKKNVIQINEDKKVNDTKSILTEELPPPTVQKMKNYVKETTNEGKIIINKEQLNEMSKEALILHIINLNKVVNEIEIYLEKYTQYKKGFNSEELENSLNYKDNIINELNNKICKLKTELEEKVQSNYNNMTLVRTQNRIIDKLQKDLLFGNMIKNKHNKCLSTINTNMNTNMLINENSTCSTLIPSINNNFMNKGRILKKSNSCFHMIVNSDPLEQLGMTSTKSKIELKNDFVSICAVKSNNCRFKKKLQKSNSTINVNNTNIINNKTAIKNNNNNNNLRPLTSTKRIISNVLSNNNK